MLTDYLIRHAERWRRRIYLMPATSPSWRGWSAGAFLVKTVAQTVQKRAAMI
ncbi:MAG: hypothetical protein U1E98_06410 [Moraxella osloensis]